MHELLDELRALAQKELGYHGEIAADSQRVAVMLDISSLEATINGIEPFDLLSLSENDLGVSKGVEQARQAYNANPQESSVFLVEIDKTHSAKDVERALCLVTLDAVKETEQDVTEALSPILDAEANSLEVVTMKRVPFHGDSH